MQTFQQRISKLWAAAFNLERAAREALEHLPEPHKSALDREIRLFIRVTNSLRSK